MDVKNKIKEYELFLFGDSIDTESSKIFLEELSNVIFKCNEDEEINVTVHINLLGGSVPSSLSIYDYLTNIQKNRKNVNLIGNVIGSCCSSAILIYLAFNKRMAGKNAEFLIHSVSRNFNGSLNYCKKIFENTEYCQKIIANILMEKTNISEENINNYFNNDLDHYFYYEEAKKLGIINS